MATLKYDCSENILNVDKIEIIKLDISDLLLNLSNQPKTQDMKQQPPLYHGTDKETAIKILKERRLITTGYLGVGVCLSYKTAEKYAMQHCRNENLQQSDICVIRFGIYTQKERMDAACHCTDGGGFALHDDIGCPLKEVVIFEAKITDRETEDIGETAKSSVVAHGASSRNHMPEPAHATT